MDTNLLRSWLGLSPGSWPPDDRTLLGLPDGPPDPADAERRVLTLMGRLRPHQLVHPELVTEGMNRLAQALLAVTAIASAPPRSAPAAPQPEPPPVEREIPLAAAVDVLTEPGNPIEFEATVLEAQLPVQSTLPPPEVLPPPVGEEAPQPSVPVLSSGAEPVGQRAEDRRTAYRELAGIRGLLRAWDTLRGTIADPSTGLNTPDKVFEFLDGVQSVRAAAIHPGLDLSILHDVAPTVASVIRQPLPLAVFRSLVPSQRQTLARSWARGRSAIVSRSAALRAGVRLAAPPRRTVTVRAVVHSIMRNPEWGLLVASAMILAMVAVRAVAR